MLHKLPNNNLISSGLILLAPTVYCYIICILPIIVLKFPAFEGKNQFA